METPKEFFNLSSITSVAGAAGIVLVLTNFFAYLHEKYTKEDAVRFRLNMGIAVAAIVAVLAMLASPPSGDWATVSGFWGWLAVVFLWFANTCLLFVTAFGGSKLSAAGAGEAGIQDLLAERKALAVVKSPTEAQTTARKEVVARFWRPW